MEAPQALSERRRREGRGACAEGGRCGRGCPPPRQLGGLGSAVSSPSGVRGEAPEALIFQHFEANGGCWSSQMLIVYCLTSTDFVVVFLHFMKDVLSLCEMGCFS